MKRINLAIKLKILGAIFVCLLFSTQLSAQIPGVTVPQLTGISPHEATVGSFDFTLVVSGSNFMRTAVVRVNGSDRVTTYVSSTQLKAIIPARDLASTGLLQITVLNPGSHGTESLPLTLLVSAQISPLISAVSPSKIIAGSSTNSITINGAYFFPDPVAQINGANRTTTGGFGRINEPLTSDDTTAPGFLNVSVFTSLGGTSNVMSLPVFRYGDVNFDGIINVTDLAQMANSISGNVVLSEPTAADLNLDGKVDNADLTILANWLAGNIFNLPVAAPPPTLTALSPAKVVAQVTTGGDYFKLVVDGIYFPTDSVVRINGVNHFTEFVSSGRLAVAIPVVDLVTSGFMNVSVFSPSAGASTNVLTLTVFRYGDLDFNNRFDITDWNLMANAIAGHTTLIDPVAADLNLDGKIDTTDLSILGNFFAGIIHKLPVLGPPPVLNAISPQKVVVGGPTLSLTIDGSNFPSNSVVQINGSNRATSFVSSNRLIATIPATDLAILGFLDVSVFSPDAGVNSNGLPLTIFRYGDLNFDNVINISDLSVMSNAISGSFTLPDTAPADLNLDGSVDTADLNILANYLAGNIHSLPVVADFSMTTAVDSQEITAGDTAVFSISATALNGFSGNISLSVDGLPWGTTSSFWPATITGSGSSSLYISTSTQTLAGSYVITITGQSGGLTHSASVVLIVNAVPSCGPGSVEGGLRGDFCPLQ
jgi:Dockerin type I domain